MPISSMALALASAAALLLSAGAAAEPRLDPRSQATLRLDATPDPAELPYRISFSLPAEREAYLKVSPAPGNPVFGNGTAGGPGWWTEVALDGPSGRIRSAQVTGDPPLEFGRLDANVTYNLTLVVHAPAGALAEPGLRAFEYVLAERSDNGSGSGGVLDESAGLHLSADVVGDRPGDGGGGDRFPMTLWIVAGALSLLGAGLLWFAIRKGK